MAASYTNGPFHKLLNLFIIPNKRTSMMTSHKFMLNKATLNHT